MSKKSKSLVIVESPAKEKTIGKFLGPDFVIKSSYGHVRDLPQRKLGVDVANNFNPLYVILTKAKKIIPGLKKISQGIEYLYLATDYDREGEAIAWHLSEVLNVPPERVRRITFHEITKEAIVEALKHPRAIDPRLVEAQTARRVLDRLVGYELSPLLWRKVQRGLSAGRVQSVAVRLIVDREAEIEKFVAQEYWSITAHLQKDKSESFKAFLWEKGGKRFEKLDIKNEEQARTILSELTGASYQVAKVLPKERRRQPQPPFMTSTLQQAASRRLGYSAQRTMSIAQRLYEGVDLPEGSVGLITYMRTDSLNVAASARKEAADYIRTKIGPGYLPEKPRVYKTKSKSAQEAHEAIRPTSVLRTPEDLKKHLVPEQLKLYTLIWQRFVASQMKEAVYDTVSVDISAKDYLFRATGQVLKFAGYLKVYAVTEDEEEDTGENKLPILQEGDRLNLRELVPEKHFTEPPPRYNEASLIKTMEAHGIGRPSTYAPILHTIVGRNYVRLEEKKFVPTQLGRLVNEKLKVFFPEIVDIGFTARMEEQLDEVADGSTQWTQLIKGFYVPFKASLKQAEQKMPVTKLEPQKTSELCDKCGASMLLRESRFGKYLSCSNFPRCTNKISLDVHGNKKIVQVTNIICEKCGKPMLKRIGKRGPFLACSGFPKCRNTKKLPQELAEKPASGEAAA